MARKMKLQQRIKRMPISSDWFINVAKSMGFASMDMIKEIMPNTYDMVENNATTAMDLVRDMRRNISPRNMTSNEIGKIPHIALGKSALNNALEDIKSGRIYNKERIFTESEFDNMGGDLGLDFELFDDDDGDGMSIDDDGFSLDIGDDEDDESDTNITKNVTVNNNKTIHNVIDMMPLANVVSANTEATIQAIGAATEQSIGVETEKIIFNHRVMQSVVGRLEAITDNTAELVKFHGDSTSKFYASAISYFQETTEFFKKNLTKATPENKDFEKDSVLFGSVYNSEGNLDLERFIERVKENMKEATDGTEVGMLKDIFGDVSSLSDLAKNPLGNLLNLGMQKIIAPVTKQALSALDESISSIMPAITAKINQMEDSDNRLFAAIYNTFNTKKKINSYVDLGEYYKGDMSWNGIANKTLVEIIPAHLRRIEAALTGQSERIFDYNTGKFSNSDEIKKSFDKELMDARTSGYTSIMTTLKTNARNAGIKGKDLERYGEILDEYLSTMSKKGSMINPFLYNDADGTVVDELGLTFDWDDTEKRILRESIKSLSTKELTQLFTSGIYDSRTTENAMWQEIKNNPDYKGYALLHNNGLFDKDGKLIYDPTKNSGIVNDKKDKFGLSSLDYIRDIKLMLAKGIQVFTTNGPNPHANIFNAMINQPIVENNNKQKSKNEENIDTFKLFEGLSDRDLSILMGEAAEKNSENDKNEEMLNRDKYGYTLKELDKYNKDVEYIQAKIDNAKNSGDTEKQKKAEEELEELKSEFKRKTNRRRNNPISILRTKLAGIINKPVDTITDTINSVMYRFLFELDPNMTEADMFDIIKNKITEGRNQRGINGNNKRNIISKTKDNIQDKFKGIITYFTGEDYLDHEGNVIQRDEDSIFYRMKNMFTTTSEKFQKFLFGDDFTDKENRKLSNGKLVKAIKSKLEKHGKNINPKLATFLGSAGLATGIAQGVGLLPSFLLPGGPIIGSMLGLAGGIMASSEKFQKFLFGDTEEDGRRYGGILTQFTNWFQGTVMDPFKIKMTAVRNSVLDFVEDKVIDPIANMFAPLTQSFKFVIEDTKNLMKRTWESISGGVIKSFKTDVVKPFGESLEKYVVDPMKKLFNTAFSAIGKILGLIISSPIRAVTGIVGGLSNAYNKRHVLKDDYKKRRESNGFVKSVFGTLYNKQDIFKNNLYYMSDEYKEKQEEKKQEKQKRRDKRNEKLAEMERKYQEDLEFGKQNNWIFKSKKQKEQHEQDVKERAIWAAQEQVIQTTEINDNSKDIVAKLTVLEGLSEKIPKFDDEKKKQLDDLKKELLGKLDTLIQLGQGGEKGEEVLNRFRSKLRDSSYERPKKDEDTDNTKIEGSHAEGLDEVPKDGYIAELHEGEMVVPKEGAENLRDAGKEGTKKNSIISRLFGNKDDKDDDGLLGNLFNKLTGKNRDEDKQRKDNRHGLTDLEQKQAKEALDDQRYAFASRKNVDYLQNKWKEKDKEKEEKKWKAAVLTALEKQTKTTEKGQSFWSKLFGNNGLLGTFFSLGSKLIPMLIALLAGGSLFSLFNNDNSNVGSIVEQVTDKVNGEDEQHLNKDNEYVNNGVEASTKKFMATTGVPYLAKKSAPMLNAVGKVAVKGAKGVKKAGSLVKTAGTKLYKYANPTMTFKVGGKEFTTSYKLPRKGLQKPIGAITDTATAGKKLIEKLINKGSEALTKLMSFASKKIPGLTKVADIGAKVWKFLRNNVDNVIQKFGLKIGEELGENVAKSIPFAGWVLQAGFTTYDLITGGTEGNAANLFQVSEEDVDGNMKSISRIIQTVTNFSWASLIWLINDITKTLIDHSFLRDIAIAMYNAKADSDKSKFTVRDGISEEELKNTSDLQTMSQKLGINYNDLKGKDPKDIDWSKYKLTATEKFNLQKTMYNEKHGTKLSNSAYADESSPLAGQKIFKTVNNWGKNLKSFYSEKNAKNAYGMNKNANMTLREKGSYYLSKGVLNVNNFAAKHLGIGKEYTNSEWFRAKNYDENGNYVGPNLGTMSYAEKRNMKDQKKVDKANEAINKLMTNGQNERGGVEKWINDMKIGWYKGKRERARKHMGDKDAKEDNRNDNIFETVGGWFGLGNRRKKDKEENKKDKKTDSNKDKQIKKTADQELLEKRDKASGNLFQGLKNFITPKKVTDKQIKSAKDNAYDKKQETKKSAKPLTEEIKDFLKPKQNNSKIKNPKITGKPTESKELKKQKEKDSKFNFMRSVNKLFGMKEFDTSKGDKLSVSEEMKKDEKNTKQQIQKNRKSVSDTLKKMLNLNNDTTKDMTENMKKSQLLMTKAYNKQQKSITDTSKETSKTLDKNTSDLKKKLEKAGKSLVDSAKGLFNMASEKVKSMFSSLSNIQVSSIVPTINIGNPVDFVVDLLKKVFTQDDTSSTDSNNSTNNNSKNDNDKSTWEKLKDGASNAWDSIKNRFKSGLTSKEKQEIRSMKINKHESSNDNYITPTNTTNTTNNSTNNVNKSVNRFVFYNQADSRWGNKNIIGGRSMRDAGCGPTSIAMALSQVTGQMITPDTIATLGSEHLPGYSTFSLFPTIANKLGMNYEESTDNNKTSFIRTRLEKGLPVLLSGRSNNKNSPFTNEGHVVTATKIDGNKIFVQDPKGKELSKYYDINDITPGLMKAMAYSPSSYTNYSNLPSSGKLDLETGIYKDYSKNPLGMYGDGPSAFSDENAGLEGAEKVRIIDRVGSYMRAFLNNKDKFSYSQPLRDEINHNKSHADCSSFVGHVLTVAGDTPVSGTSQSIWDSVGTKVTKPQVGDIVCRQGHVGLYAGDGKFIHMTSSQSIGRTIGITDVNTSGWGALRGYKRVLKEPEKKVDPVIKNANKLLGTVTATSSGTPVEGGSGITDDTTTTTTDGTAATQAETPELLGVFSKMNQLTQNFVGSMYNGKDVDLFAASTTTDSTSDTSNSNLQSGVAGDYLGKYGCYGETSGKPNYVSNGSQWGDYDSFGIYQMASMGDTARDSTPAGFRDWTQKNYPSLASYFKGTHVGKRSGGTFKAAWKKAASEKPNELIDAQVKFFTKPGLFYQDWVSKLKSKHNFNAESDRAYQEMVVGAAANGFYQAKYAKAFNKGLKGEALVKEFLKGRYSERANKNYDKAFYNRFISENGDFKHLKEVIGKPAIAYGYSGASAGTGSSDNYNDYFLDNADEIPEELMYGSESAGKDTSSSSSSTYPTTMNKYAYFSQVDPRWNKSGIGGTTVAKAGCGPTSHAMMLTTMFGKQINPYTMAKFGLNKGAWSSSGMGWNMPTTVAKSFGLKITNTWQGKSDSTLSSIKEQLKSGHPVVMSGRTSGSNRNYSTPFTPGGHIVLAVGVDGSGNIIINDPRAANRSKAYTDAGLREGVGLRGAWAFAKTGSSSIPSGFTVDGDYVPGADVATDSTVDGTTTTQAETPEMLGVFSKMNQIVQNYVGSIFNGKDVDLFASSNSSSTDTTTTNATGTGDFPKYNLNDNQIKGLAAIIQTEQPGYDGCQAEASLLANLTDISGDDKATPENIIAKATGGWFGQRAKKAFNSPNTAKQIAIDAVKSVIVGGRRTLPRYVNEHDCFSDIKSATNNGSAIKISDRSAYKQHVTKIKNVYGATGTFYGFPNSQADPFFYTSDTYRQKWGENCYEPLSAGSGNNLSKMSGSAGKGDGDGKVHLIAPATDNKAKPTTNAEVKASAKMGRIKVGLGSGTVEKLKKVSSNLLSTGKLKNITKATKTESVNYVDNSNVAICLDGMAEVLSELKEINVNTANTAENISKIQIYSANEPVSKYTNQNNNSNNTVKKTLNNRAGSIASSKDYTTARRLASFS